MATSRLVSFLDSCRDTICGRYSDRVSSAVSVRALAEILDVNVCEWLCIEDGGKDVKSWLESCFGGFVRGGYEKECDGYTASVLCGDGGEVVLSSDVTALLFSGETRVRSPRPYARVFLSRGRYLLDVDEGCTLIVTAHSGAEYEAVGGGSVLAK